MLEFQDKVRIFEKKLKKFLSNHDAIFVQKTIQIEKLDKNIGSFEKSVGKKGKETG